jgi:hypothetical protein
VRFDVREKRFQPFAVKQALSFNVLKQMLATG